MKYEFVKWLFKENVGEQNLSYLEIFISNI